MLASAGTAKCVASPSSILRLGFMLFDVLVHPGNNISTFLLDVGLTSPILSVPGSLNAFGTAPSGWQEKMYGLDTNPPPCHRRGRCPFVMRWSQCSSHACGSNAAVMYAIYKGILR